MKYKKKPVIIEAIQWDGTNVDEIKKFAGAYRCDANGDKLYIDTLEGTMTASLNDFIIKGVKGEIYPCKPDIFADTYDPA